MTYLELRARGLILPPPSEVEMGPSRRTNPPRRETRSAPSPAIPGGRPEAHHLMLKASAGCLPRYSVKAGISARASERAGGGIMQRWVLRERPSACP